MKKMWGGRFKGKTDPLFEAFSRQPAVDEALLYDELRGSLAYAKMLGKIGLLTKRESARLVKALSGMIDAHLKGKLSYDPRAEDVHTFVEASLIRKVGALGKKLQTGRSRNEQVSLDTRLYCKRAIASLLWHLNRFQKGLVRTARKYRQVIFPGYTHLRHAQPVLFAHHLLAYCEMLERDKARLEETKTRVDVMPLGSGAMAGSAFPLDRTHLAKLLGFSRISENSIDAVSDRDFVIELLSDLALLAMHLSRLSEELILWGTEEFGFIEMDERFMTGSSLMPQKQNPDFLELVRGETGRVYGHLVSVLTTMKGLPLAYNRDMQLDKAPLIVSVAQLHKILALFPPFLEGMTLHEEALKPHLQADALFATDLAEYLVQKGVPFREAHQSVGTLLRFLKGRKRRLRSLTLLELRRFSPKFERDVYALLHPEGSIKRKVSFGGTGTGEVKRQIAKWERKRSR